ncbi:hypothetical protein ACHAWO_001028 [Cyclotella atomus]|jgi:hypothetical protein|uniref:Methyltransferase domain-containing protein n=1 Tax=Cyclotella atomus TaxID=382360 RepID=A0ABD3NS38_9STRA
MHEFANRQRNKEEGKCRAREIAIAKQSTQIQTTTVKVGSSRHGARNQHRHKHFAKWILSTFPHIEKECSDSDSDGESTMHILDVAGGKGETSARLCLCHSLRVKMVDPRQADIASVYIKDVVPKLPNKWQASVYRRLEASPTFVDDLLEKRFEQLVMPFVVPNNECLDWSQQNTAASLLEAVKNASLIIGLHADGATEAIVDAALHYSKPFVVVPCCVFPNLFCNRFLSIEDTDEVGHVRTRQIPVRTHEQFCEYLLKRDSRFKQVVLPFEGRNIAIWWDGKA